MPINYLLQFKVDYCESFAVTQANILRLCVFEASDVCKAKNDDEI